MRLHLFLYAQAMSINILPLLIIHSTNNPLICIHGISIWCIRIIEECIFHIFSTFFKFLFMSIIMFFLNVNKNALHDRMNFVLIKLSPSSYIILKCFKAASIAFTFSSGHPGCLLFADFALLQFSLSIIPCFCFT